jgi:hypothetical protein
MCALANARERRGEYSLSGGLQPGADALPDPIALPGTVHKHEGGCCPAHCSGSITSAVHAAANGTRHDNDGGGRIASRRRDTRGRRASTQ